MPMIHASVPSEPSKKPLPMPRKRTWLKKVITTWYVHGAMAKKSTGTPWYTLEI